MDGPVFFGVRHLSPGAAFRLRQALDACRPQLILVEGPSDLNAQMHWLCHPETKLPAAILAYTSQMMHIIAVSVCDDPMLFTCKGFEGSSFRGCTRVAALDVGLWTQLFSLNRPALLTVLDRLLGRTRKGAR